MPQLLETFMTMLSFHEMSSSKQIVPSLSDSASLTFPEQWQKAASQVGLIASDTSGVGPQAPHLSKNLVSQIPTRMYISWAHSTGLLYPVSTAPDSTMFLPHQVQKPMVGTVSFVQEPAPLLAQMLCITFS